ncbi:Rossmann-like domain-containing protein [Desulfoscipio sp. XC116]|uniref:Rossmann-like domain-containing protein n=1 Tax=Desulfoscipio sp. XC116 TaxID=3144975 RepID=UPI00325AFD31
MEIPTIFKDLEPHINDILRDPQLSDATVKITCRALTVQEAIGSPERNDFPLQKGKEKLMQANIDGFAGQAFTDMPGLYEGTLESALTMPATNNFRRAVIIASLNAALRKLGRASNTIHCKDAGPKECSLQAVQFVKQTFGDPKIAVIGLQPAIAEQLAGHFETRVFDLDPDNIGHVKCNVLIEDGDIDPQEIEAWSDIIFATGSTIANGTIDPFIKMKKPVFFYGTTIAGVADLLGLKRFCPTSA